MISEEVASEIIKIIQGWSANSPRLVVAIDGIPGVGKSTIMKLMQGKIDALLVHMDNFLTPIEYRQKLVDDGVSPEELVAGLFDYDDIKDLIKRYGDGEEKELKTLAYKSGKRQLEVVYDLTKPVLVIEGTYLLNDDYFKDLWDRIIYLDGDGEEIKQRRIARTREMMGDKFIAEDDPRSFFNLGLIAFKNYQYKYQPKEKADLVLNITSD